MKKEVNSKTEKWFKKRHKDIENSVWISEDTKNIYRNLLKQAYKDGYQDGTKDRISTSMKG